MVRYGRTARKNSWAYERVWHPDTTAAAEHGGAERIAQAHAAREIRRGNVLLDPDVTSFCKRHSGEAGGAPVPQSPFPAGTSFGILPYAAWHGQIEAVAGFIQQVPRSTTPQR